MNVALRWIAAASLACVAGACASPHRAPLKKDTTQVADAAPDGENAKDSTQTQDAATSPDASMADVGTSDIVTADAEQSDTANATDAQTPPDAGLPDEGTACFIGGPPGPNDKVKSPPKPKVSCPNFDGPFVGSPGDNLGEASLKVEVGVLDANSKAFVPFTPADFVGFEPGAQPGFHIWLAFRVTIPGQTAEQVNLEVGARGLVDCAAFGFGALPNYYANKDPSVPNAYVFHHKLNTGFPLICQQKGCTAGAFCGIWYDVRLQVRDYSTNKWGKAQILLRLWDGVTKS